MKYYIVTWVLVKTVFASCPDTIDEFQRTVSHYNESCNTTKTDTLQRGFSDKKEALDFYKKGLGQKDSDTTFLLANQEHIVDIKIDSGYSKDVRIINANSDRFKPVLYFNK